MATVEYAHVGVNSDGVPIILGTQTKVVEIALDHLAHGSDAPELHRQFPHLALGQIHSALAYYYDHKAEMDADIEQRKRKVEQLKTEMDELQGPSTLRQKLKAMGRLA